MARVTHRVGERVGSAHPGFELLPEGLFRQLGNVDSGLPRLIEAAGNRDVYPDLRVVSARIDPCFDGPSDAGLCERQIRLAAQVLDPTDGTLSDAAIHLFYRLDDARFIDTLARLRELSRARPVSGPLGVHPALTDAHLALIRAQCTRLDRFTLMATGRSKNWFFFIFDRQADGSFTQSTIPWCPARRERRAAGRTRRCPGPGRATCGRR